MLLLCLKFVSVFFPCRFELDNDVLQSESMM